MQRISVLIAVLGFLSVAGVPGTATGQPGERMRAAELGPDFEGRVELDRQVYSSHDTVRITAFSPGHDTDARAVEAVVVTIATRDALLSDYPLRETGPDTGVFTGEIALDGLAIRDDDAISVSFEVSSTETALAAGRIRREP